jgi:hypothetical protein
MKQYSTHTSSTGLTQAVQHSRKQCALCSALIEHNRRENTQKYEVLLNNLIADFTILSIPMFLCIHFNLCVVHSVYLKGSADHQKDSNEPSVRHV